ncbi:MAG: Fe-Mn family superoxide dismutase [Patescibacteria group bacterium]|nr:MAG: Fe-Mn family superoxide dismutase [Patescibacteria group bacterium]
MAEKIKTFMYKAKNYEHLLGMQGFSDELLKNHFKLYEGYVTNMNKLNDILIAMEKDDKWSVPEFAELNRRLGWEWDGMRLHELYFGNMGKDVRKLEEGSKLYEKIVAEWGSYEMWEKDFRAMGAMRGIGWVILYYDKPAERLFNIWINEHDSGHLVGAVPLLVMDVFEHAFILDYGLNRGGYIESFMNAIDWSEGAERLKG